jgi:serine/threonine-protein phosphatase 2B catalytic subunit
MEQDVPLPKREIILHGARHTTTGRVVDSVPAPASKVLEWDEVFDVDGKPRAEVIKQHFIREGRMHEDHILKIVTEAQAILAQEPNLLEVAAPATGMP